MRKYKSINSINIDRLFKQLRLLLLQAMEQKNNPLHGITLETILNTLVEDYGWKELARIVRINCFISNPSIKSSLTFLRKTPWARQKVEELYLKSHRT
jgi:uncharacterized protein (DUF2132 family)